MSWQNALRVHPRMHSAPIPFGVLLGVFKTIFLGGTGAHLLVQLLVLPVQLVNSFLFSGYI
jgi:hypothetical protein